MKLIDTMKKIRIPMLEMAAIVFMLIAWGISLGDYTGVVSKLWGWKKEVVHTSIRPDFLSAMFACGLYAAFVFRRVIKPFNRITTLILTVLDIFYLASFIGMLTGGKQDPLPVIGISPMGLLVGVLLFSFVGMRSLSGVIVLVLIVAALPRLSDSNAAMGVAGAVFVVSGFCSLIIQSKLPDMLPIGAHFNELMNDFRGVQQSLSQNVSEAVDSAKTIAHGVGTAAVTAATGVPVQSVARMKNDAE